MSIIDEKVKGQNKLQLEDFEIIKTLGSGAFGSVYLVTRKNRKEG